MIRSIYAALKNDLIRTVEVASILYLPFANRQIGQDLAKPIR